jgi:hypothetical protein
LVGPTRNSPVSFAHRLTAPPANGWWKNMEKLAGYTINGYYIFSYIFYAMGICIIYGYLYMYHLWVLLYNHLTMGVLD